MHNFLTLHANVDESESERGRTSDRSLSIIVHNNIDDDDDDDDDDDERVPLFVDKKLLRVRA
jgi:hypothetical protein